MLYCNCSSLPHSSWSSRIYRLKSKINNYLSLSPYCPILPLIVLRRMRAGYCSRERRAFPGKKRRWTEWNDQMCYCKFILLDICTRDDRIQDLFGWRWSRRFIRLVPSSASSSVLPAAPQLPRRPFPRRVSQRPRHSNRAASWWSTVSHPGTSGPRGRIQSAASWRALLSSGSPLLAGTASDCSEKKKQLRRPKSS